MFDLPTFQAELLVPLCRRESKARAQGKGAGSGTGCHWLILQGADNAMWLFLQHDFDIILLHRFNRRREENIGNNLQFCLKSTLKVKTSGAMNVSVNLRCPKR
jgi:hypothetical protein